MKKAMNVRRRLILPGWFGLFFGVTSFFRVSGKPRFQTYHTLDVIGLMTAGAGFAVAIMALVMFFTFGRGAAENMVGEKSGQPS